MKILAVDNEILQLKQLVDAIRGAEPEAEIFAFNNSVKALEWAETECPQIAFLDIKMPVLSGIQLAKELKRLDPSINLVFVTGFFEDYLANALPLRFSGYLQKPATVKAVKAEMEHLRFPIPQKDEKTLLTVQCFGNFEVFHNGKAVQFNRSKTKELFALLIDQKGARINGNVICASLFEDSDNENNNKSYLRKCVSDLRAALKAVDAEEVFLKDFNSYAVDTSLISCDYYDWEKDEPYAIRAFHGEYMSQYSWGEETLAGLLYRKK